MYAVEMVFQVGTFSDAAVFRIAGPILIRFDFAWVIFSPRDDYHTGLYSHWTLILFELLPGNHFYIPDSKKEDAGVADSNSREKRSTLGNITGLSKPWMLFLQNLISIVLFFVFFYDASGYNPLSEPNKRKRELFVLISPDYREKCKTWKSKIIRQNRLKHLCLQRNSIMCKTNKILNISFSGNRHDILVSLHLGSHMLIQWIKIIQLLIPLFYKILLTYT